MPTLNLPIATVDDAQPRMLRRAESPSAPVALVNVQTFGCQMNEYDSELVGTILHDQGFAFTDDDRAADVVLFNTCAIRETAHLRIYSRLDALLHERKDRPGFVVGVLGCMAQNLKEDLLLRFPVVDFICGPDGYRQLPDLISRTRTLRERGTAIELSEYETYDDIAPTRVDGVNAWIAIMRGCDNFCTFCVVPYTRGRERSRDPHGIVEETRRLAGSGYKQVTLLGQNVNSYCHEKADFASLMRMVADVPGIERVRFTSPHPKDFPEPLLRAIAEDSKLCSHIHLPLQSGSDRILKKMNRGYTRDEYLRLVDHIHSLIPDISLTTDIICGFCTETDQDYRETEDVVRRVGFESAFIFKYSERVGTIAAKLWPDDVPDEIKSQRVTHLVEVQKEISLAKHRAMIGRTVSVLIEGESRKNSAEWRARTDGNAIVVFADPSHSVGDFCTVRITDATAHTLLAIPVQ